MIKEKDLMKGIGLLLMFFLGWTAQDLVSKIDCGGCNQRKVEAQQYEQRLEHYEQRRNRGQQQRQEYRPEQRYERVQPIGSDIV